MSPVLPSAEEILAKIDFASPQTSQLGLRRVDASVQRYMDAIKADIELLSGDEANQKAEEVIDRVTRVYEDLFNIANARGADEGTLCGVNNFIEDGMTMLVHNVSLDDDAERFRVFTSLLESRTNEAIWTEIFTFFFNLSDLKNAPPPLSLKFVSRFWDCYFLCQLRRPAPHYSNRIYKILYEKVHDLEYMELFKRYSRRVADHSSAERRSEIQRILEAE